MTPILQRLTNQGRALVQRIKPQSASVRNVLKLAGGTAGSQAITVAAAPILTRLYGPESFGVLATFASILVLLNVVSSMSYELAISVPEDEEEAVHILMLCLFLVLSTAALVAAVVFFFGKSLVDLSDQPSLLTLLWLLPVGTFSIGLYSSLSYWAIRSQKFGSLAKTKVIQSISGQICNIVLSPLGPTGLAIGSIVSQSMGSLGLFTRYNIRKIHQSCLQASPIIYHLSISELAKVSKKYYPIAVNNTLARLLNSFYPFLVSIVLSVSDELSSLGLLFFLKRILDTPSSLISRALGDEFLSRIARVDEKSLYTVCLNNIKRISILSTILLVPYGFILLLFGKTVFGSFWSNSASILALCLIPSSIIQLSVGSTGIAFVTSSRNFHGLIAQLLMLSMRILPIVLCLLMKQAQILPFMYALGLFLGYVAYGVVLVSSLRRGI